MGAIFPLILHQNLTNDDFFSSDDFLKVSSSPFSEIFTLCYIKTDSSILNLNRTFTHAECAARRLLRNMDSLSHPSFPNADTFHHTVSREPTH